MKNVTQRRIGPVALLVLLALLALLVVKRRYLTVEEATDETVRAVVKVENTLFHDQDAVVILLALITMFAFVTWTVLRANRGEDQALPPAGRGDLTPSRKARI
jgi:hypothetical protein